MSEVFLHVNNVFKSFAGVKALKGVSMTLKQGEARCLVGENGSGKSTLIKVISGVYQADSGAIECGGKSYSNLTPMDAINNGIQVIYQDFSVFPNLSVAENIAMSSLRAEKAKTVNWKRIKRDAQSALDRIGVKMDLDAKVEKLSVADKQLVAICRTLHSGVKLIIMDEPTTALTKKEVNSLLNIIRTLKKDGISTIFVSHKLDEVMEVSDTVTIMRNGEVVADGLVSDFDMSKFVFYMTGREVAYRVFEPGYTAGEELLRVENLSAVNGFADISFTLNRGDVLGITGLLGSGRSELAQTLFGYYRATSGNIYVNGQKTAIRNIQNALKHKIGYVPEDRLTQGLFLKQPIKTNLVAAVLDRYVKKLSYIDEDGREECAGRWLKELTIKTPDSNNLVSTLSGGNQQRVVLGKWLATEPQILILNCPTVGVDIGSKEGIHDIIRELADQGMGIIIISDDVSEVIQTCNKIVVMKKGRLTGSYKNTDIGEEGLAKELS